MRHEVRYFGHVALWVVTRGDMQIRAFHTWRAAQRLANRLNGEA